MVGRMSVKQVCHCISTILDRKSCVITGCAREDFGFLQVLVSEERRSLLHPKSHRMMKLVMFQSVVGIFAALQAELASPCSIFYKPNVSQLAEQVAPGVGVVHFGS